MLVQDFYGKGVLFQLWRNEEISVKIMKKGLILTIMPVKSIKKGDI
jgi:hypothetical protein